MQCWIQCPPLTETDQCSIRSACNGNTAGSRKVPTRRSAPRMDRPVRGAAQRAILHVKAAAARSGAGHRAVSEPRWRNAPKCQTPRRGHARLPTGAPVTRAAARARTWPALAAPARGQPGERTWLVHAVEAAPISISSLPRAYKPPRGALSQSQVPRTGPLRRFPEETRHELQAGAPSRSCRLHNARCDSGTPSPYHPSI